MSVATPTVTRIQDAHDFNQFQNWPGGALQMTPDVVPDDVTVPAGYTALWNNPEVPSAVTVEVPGLLFDPGIGVTWSTVTPPTGWTISLPFVVQRRGSVYRAYDEVFSAEFDVANYAPTGKAYYVSTSGNDANSGTDAGSPLRNIRTAFAKADIVVCYVAAGVYANLYGWWTYSLAKDISIIATGGRVTLSAHYDGLSYALDGTYTNTYTVTRSNVGGVLDTSIVDANGDYSALTKRTSAALVDANPGSWYLDGSNVLWVRLADDRAPDAYVFPQAAAGTVNSFVANGKTLYVENVDFIGGISAFSALATGAGQYPTCYFKNCSFRHSPTGNGFLSYGASTYCQNCVSSRHYDDGFNATVYLTQVPYMFEIGCTGRNNGSIGDIDNGSTIHGGGKAFRLNGRYYSNVGRNVHDVNAGVESWNVACVAHDSASAVNDANFVIGTGGTGGTMWLDYCKSYGSAADLEADTGATLYTRNCVTDGLTAGAGTITTY